MIFTSDTHNLLPPTLIIQIFSAPTCVLFPTAIWMTTCPRLTFAPAAHMGDCKRRNPTERRAGCQKAHIRVNIGRVVVPQTPDHSSDKENLPSPASSLSMCSAASTRSITCPRPRHDLSSAYISSHDAKFAYKLCSNYCKGRIRNASGGHKRMSSYRSMSMN